MAEQKTYCLGFVFTDDRMRVRLIVKETPQWQKGKYNGIGGKVNQVEQPSAAMVREFEEEAGVATCIDDWALFAVMTDNKHWTCSCYVCFNTAYFNAARTCEVEEVVEKAVRDCTTLNPKFIENVPFLVQAASVYHTFNIIHITYPEGGNDDG